MEQLLSRNKSFFCIVAVILISALMMNTAIGATTGLWHFDNNTTDSSGSGNNGSLVNLTATWVAGRMNNSLQFNGTGYVSCSSNANLKSQYGSIEFWMKATAATNVMDIIYLSRGGAYNETYYLLIRRNELGQITVLIENNNEYQVNVASATKINDTEWHHIVVTQDGTGIKIYIDGVQSAVSGTNSAYWTNHLTTIPDFRIGGSVWSECPYDGLLDEVKVCNAALTPSEVYADFESGELTGNWHLNSNASDSSIYANNGTLYNINPVTWVDAISDKALTFNGGSGYVGCSSNNSLKSSQGSVEFWMKAAATSCWYDLILFGQGNTTDYMVIRRDNYGQICVTIKITGYGGGNPVVSIWSTSNAINDTNWHHIAVTQDGYNVKIYIDGAQCTVSGTNSAYWTNLLSVTDFRIGGGYWSQNYAGLLDEVKVHYRALNSVEVNTAFEKGALAGNWHLNSNANDSSIYANNGSLVNLSATWVNGTVGKALTFNGTGYVQCTSNNSLKSAQGSVEFWMKAAAVSCWYDLVLFGQGNQNHYLVIRRDNYGQICVTIEDDDYPYVSIYTTTTINDTNWHHIVVTQDGTNVKIYIDGVQSTVSGTNSSAYWTNHFTISDFRIGGGYWFTYAGLLDEIKVYKKALSGVEVAARYENQGAANGFGCEGNPTGDPIGGGAGYSDIINPANADHYVSYKSQLLDALSSAQPGEIIYVNDLATIDLTSESGINIPAGVTLASGRGYNGSAGALLKTDTLNVCPLFIGHDGTRITGLQIRGPHSTVDASADNCGIYSMSSDNSHSSIEVDNCEISAWANGIILEDDSNNTNNSHNNNNINTGNNNHYIHHNYFHNIWQYNSGYSIYISGTTVLVEANLFDNYRHAVSGYGSAGSNCEFRYNQITANGADPDPNVEELQSFDMHGETDSRQNFGANINVTAIWRLDEGYGATTKNTALCYSQSPTETLVSMGSSCWVDGILGKALQFSGGSSHVQCTSEAGMKSSQGSIEFWMKAAAVSCLYDIIYLGDDGAPNPANYLVIRRDPYGRICVVIRSGNIERVSIYTNTTINDTNWHHIVATQDGANVKVYIDGTQSTVGGTNSSAYWTNQGTLADCRLSGGNKYWYSYAGLLDEVRVYSSKALTAADVTLHNTYNNADYCADYINIHHNTFMATDTDSWTSINIRGIPGQGCYVHNNWFYQNSGTKAVHQEYTKGNMSTYLNLFTTERILEQ